MHTMRLPVRLTDEELQQKGDALAVSLQHAAALKADKKASADRYKQEIEAEGDRASKLAEEISSRQEYRKIQVSERKDWERYTVETVRLDSGEVVETRGMTPQEMQEPLPFRERAHVVDGEEVRA